MFGDSDFATNRYYRDVRKRQPLPQRGQLADRGIRPHLDSSPRPRIRARLQLTADRRPSSSSGSRSSSCRSWCSAVGSRHLAPKEGAVKFKYTICSFGSRLSSCWPSSCSSTKRPADKAAGPRREIRDADGGRRPKDHAQEGERDAHLQEGRQGRLDGRRSRWRSRPTTTEVGQLVDAFADLKIERVVEKESGDLEEIPDPAERSLDLGQRPGQPRSRS